ncbi:MAG: response regulator [Methanoregula sp.]
MISVLYVDDDQSLLEISKFYLENTGEFHIDTVESAPRALDLLQHRHYDAVISDYQMPEMNGIEFLKILQKKYPTLPVIIFTGKNRDEIAITAFENGADFYVQKGGAAKAQFAELSHKIRKSVEQCQTKQALKESESRLRQYIQNASDLTRILDKDGRVVYDSPSTSHIFGYPEHFLLGKHVVDFIHPKDQKTAITAFDHIRNRTNPGIPIEFRIRKADGEYIDVESVAMNLIGVNGVDGIVVTTWPTPERKCAKQE